MTVTESPVLQHVAVRIPHDRLSVVIFRQRCSGPFVATGHAFMLVSRIENIDHRADRAGKGFVHTGVFSNEAQSVIILDVLVLGAPTR